MDKNMVKLLVKLLYVSRNEIPGLLGGLDGDTGGSGFIAIPEDLVNGTWRDLIIKESKGKLEDYKVSFKDQQIFIEADVKILMRVKAKLALRIEKFSFVPGNYETTISYETIGGGAANAFIPRLVQSAARIRPKLMRVKGNLIEVDLTEFGESFPFLLIEYKGAESGFLKGSFAII